MHAGGIFVELTNNGGHAMLFPSADRRKESVVVLRDMIESVIEDYVRWFTRPGEDNDWERWDAPWK